MSHKVAESLHQLQTDGQREALLLMTKALRAMQPQALKHAYITSVVNVLLHPEVVHEDDLGTQHIIGFGNQERTLPLVIIREKEPDGTIRHAFVPSENNPLERKLIAALQARDNAWAERHDAGKRNIARNIRDRGRAQVNRHGINMHDPAPRVIESERATEKPWLRTDFIYPEHEVNSDRSLDTEYGSADMRRIERGIETAVKMAGRDMAPGSIDVRLGLDLKRRTLLLADLDYRISRLDQPEGCQPEY